MHGIVFVYDLERSRLNRQFTIRLETRTYVNNQWVKASHQKIFSASDFANQEILSLIVDRFMFQRILKDEMAFRKIEGRFFFSEDEFTILRVSFSSLHDFLKRCETTNALCDPSGKTLRFHIRKEIKPDIEIILSEKGYQIRAMVCGLDLKKADYFIRTSRMICVLDRMIVFLTDRLPRSFLDGFLSTSFFSYEELESVKKKLDEYSDNLSIHFPSDMTKKVVRNARFRKILNLAPSLSRGDLVFVYQNQFHVRFNDEKKIFFDFHKNLEIHRNNTEELKVIEEMESLGVLFHPPGKGKVYLSAENLLEQLKAIEKTGIILMMGEKAFRYDIPVNWFLSMNGEVLSVTGGISMKEGKTDISNLLDAYLSGRKYFDLPDRSVAYMSEQIHNLLKSLEIKGDFKDEAILFRREEFFIVSDIFKDKTNVTSNRVYKNSLQLKNRADQDIEIPESFDCELRSYQKTGFRWLMRLFSLGFSGILADDMGLGKTVQTLALLLGIKKIRKRSSSLLIVPKTLIWNWESEIKRFAPTLTYHLYIGEKKERSLKKFSDVDLIIINYHLVLNDFDVLKKKKWQCLILDEAQTIKNPEAKMTRTIKKLRADFKLSLTGTPVENRPLDLWSQFDFLMPGFLGGMKRFKKKYEKGGKKSLQELKQMTAPFILRREKKEVLLELPEKTEIIRYCEFAETQRNLYEEVRLSDRLIMESMDNDRSKQTIHLLTMILRLRQISCHPLLYPGSEAWALIPDSGKLDAVLETADEILSENHKILIFSQFVKHLELIKKECDQRNIENFILHGSTPNRSDIIRQFKESQGPSIFFISLKAGGFGINLTEASYVFLLDPWWNPAVENQAIDRCYRMGQKKNVTVIRFITKDSIEERVKKLQLRKQEMIDEVITGTDSHPSPFTHDELMSLITY